MLNNATDITNPPALDLSRDFPDEEVRLAWVVRNVSNKSTFADL